MAFTSTFATSWSRGGQQVSATYTTTSDGEDQREIILGAEAVHTQVDVSWTNSLLKSIVIVSDQDMVLDTNSSSTPNTTLNFKANVPLIWDSNMPITNPFTAANVTTIYLSNSTNTAATVKIVVEKDATPGV